MPPIYWLVVLDKLKKFRSIESDLETFKKALSTLLCEDINAVLPGTKTINNLGAKVKISIYKVKHFRCQTLKGKGSRSGIRVIYTFKDNKIILIEIYYKENKEKEDRTRILTYFSDNK